MASRGAEHGTANLRVSVASGDTLDVRQFTVRERMSALFRVTLVAVSDNTDIDFESVAGKEARFMIQHSPLADAPPRSWSGLCVEIDQIAAETDGLSTYHIDLAPSLWLATQRRNHRMFQQLSELDIARTLLAEWGEKPIERLGGTYKKRKYRVQYGESDFAFLSRMLEEAGISFHFEQEGDKTRIVLADAPQAGEARPPLPHRDDVSTAHGEYATHVRVSRKVRPGRYTIRDHDYRKDPKYKLVAGAAVKAGGVEEKLESYHYTPGAFLFGAEQGESTPQADDRGKARTDESEAALLAQKRLDAKRGSATTCAFETNAIDVSPGVVVTFLGYPRSDLGDGKRFLVVESVLSGVRDSTWTHQCEAQRADVAYRPPLGTPKPTTNGVESATVVGPEGEEIHVDEFGRVRVHFHWDRESQMDDKSSCWIHVSQPWGGSGFGGTALPRIGQEVLVDFLGGDPDRPVIVGRVFTNLQKTPYKLPENKTQSGLKSNSTGGGGGYNELMFEDAVGKELLRMQAEKDMNKLVKNDEQSTVGRDRTRLVKRNESVTVGGNRTHLVKLNEKQVVGLNQTLSVGINRATQVGAIDSTIVGDTHLVMISPPGEGGGGSTSVIMKDKKIVLDTGAGASITMDGSTITVKATNIFLFAEAFLGAASFGVTVVGGMANTTVGSPATTVLAGGFCTVTGSTGVSISSSGGDVSIKGGPLVKINT